MSIAKIGLRPRRTPAERQLAPQIDAVREQRKRRCHHGTVTELLGPGTRPISIMFPERITVRVQEDGVWVEGRLAVDADGSKVVREFKIRV